MWGDPAWSVREQVARFPLAGGCPGPVWKTDPEKGLYPLSVGYLLGSALLARPDGLAPWLVGVLHVPLDGCQDLAREAPLEQ